MNDKTQLYVFSKKEVALIFLLMMLIALTSFIFGIKIGKDFSYQEAGFSKEDLQNVNLQSKKEERVDEILGHEDDGILENEKLDASDKDPKKMSAELEKALKDQFDKEFNKKSMDLDAGEEKEAVKNSALKSTDPLIQAELKKEEIDNKVIKEEATAKKDKDNLTGKFTIQLASYRAVKDAEAFANGFKIRGYNPIINEVDLKEKGVWFRVSLGVFDSIAGAKEYLLEEKSLFYGMDPRFVKFD